MTPPPARPRYTLIPRPEATADILALAAHGPDVVAAAVAITDDLAPGRVVGKELGVRSVSGDLTGLARVKFDVPGQRPQRFRLVYRQLDKATREIVAIGPRDQHAIYRLVARRRPRRSRRRPSSPVR